MRSSNMYCSILRIYYKMNYVSKRLIIVPVITTNYSGTTPWELRAVALISIHEKTFLSINLRRPKVFTSRKQSHVICPFQLCKAFPLFCLCHYSPPSNLLK